MRPDTFALIAAVIPAVAFVVLYLRELSYVKQSPEARHLIGFTAVLALILLEELARRVFRDYIPLLFHRVFVAIAVLAAAAYLWQRLYMLLRYQVLPRRRRQKAAREEENEYHEHTH